MLLDVNNVKRVFGRGLNATTALNGIPFNMDRGKFVAIMGESGSGKPTLLNLTTTYDKATEGTITIDTQNIRQLHNREIAYFRRDHLGFVSQDFSILLITTNRDNILIPLMLADCSHQTTRHRLYRLSYRLHIEPLLDKHPFEMSGGKQRRMAICRAPANELDLLLTGEPIGVFDSKASKAIVELPRDISKNEQITLMVAHSAIDIPYAKCISFIEDGRLYHEICRGEELQLEFQRRIAGNLAVSHKSGD